MNWTLIVPALAGAGLLVVLVLACCVTTGRRRRSSARAKVQPMYGKGDAMDETFAIGDQIDVAYPSGKTRRYTIAVLVGRPTHTVVAFRDRDTQQFLLDRPSWYSITKVTTPGQKGGDA